MCATQLPVTLLLDGNITICGYDFWSPDERTYVITRFFNIVIGELNAELFDFPQPR